MSETYETVFDRAPELQDGGYLPGTTAGQTSFGALLQGHEGEQTMPQNEELTMKEFPEPTMSLVEAETAKKNYTSKCGR